MQTIEASTRRPSAASIIRASIKQSGFQGLYAGLTASLMRQMSYSLVRLGTYEELKARVSQNGPPSTFSLIFAASIAGGLGGVAGNPAGTAKLLPFYHLFQADTTLHKISCLSE